MCCCEDGNATATSTQHCLHTCDLRLLVGAERCGGVGHSPGEGVVVRVDRAADGPEAIPAGTPGSSQPVPVCVRSEPVEPRRGLCRHQHS